MPYIRLGLKTGDILMADHIDHIEDALEDLAKWQDNKDYVKMYFSTFYVVSVTDKDNNTTDFEQSDSNQGITKVEKGRKIKSVKLKWSYNVNKNPKEQLWGNTPPPDSLFEVLEELNVSDREKIVGSKEGEYFTDNKSWRLRATDEKDESIFDDAGISFCNGVYYGVKAIDNTMDISKFIMSLSGKTLTDSYVGSFTVDNSKKGEYIWYCLPIGAGTRKFAINGGISGGFQLVKTSDGKDYHSFTNAYDHTENYYVYRTDFPALGERQSVKVS